MIRDLFAIGLGKLLHKFIRSFRLGGGSSAPGLYALKLSPQLVSNLGKQIPQNVLVTGTNGKTTTSRLIAHFAKAEGLRVIHNSTGSNMERGIASKLTEEANLLGRVKADLAIWEVDEANLKNIILKVRPDLVVILNAARDQLDRYGELDSLVREWREALSKVTTPTLVLVNGDDLNTHNLTLHPKGGKLKFQTFGLDKKLVNWEENAPSGKKDFMAKDIRARGLLGTTFAIDHRIINLPVPGAYNIYNFLAAFAVGLNLKFSPEKMVKSLASFKTAFGRIEKVDIKGKQGYVCLIKNPNGASLMFQTLSSQLKPTDHVLLALNDNLADGTDVSWIWDANFEEFSNSPKLFVSGKRAEDLALRLKYAGLEPKLIDPNLKQALNLSLKSLKGRLFILPTYTAMLEMQQILAEMGVKKPYWEEV